MIASFTTESPSGDISRGRAEPLLFDASSSIDPSDPSNAAQAMRFVAYKFQKGRCVRMCACVHACMHACVCVCVRVDRPVMCVAMQKAFNRPPKQASIVSCVSFRCHAYMQVLVPLPASRRSL